MSDRQPVVCFAGDNYWFSNPHSRYHLMHALHRRGHPILWVNSIGMNLPKLRRSGFAKRVALKLRSWARWLGEAQTGFHILTPVALPLFGNRYLESFNDRWMTAQVKLAYRLLGIRRPLVFASIPSFAGVIERLPHSGLIYYFSDKYDAYRDITARDSIAAYDRRLFASADAVFCASARIYENLADKRPGVYYLPHAVDFEHFNSALSSDLPIPDDLAAVGQPRVGYFGSVTDSNDQEMIAYAAERAPDIHFVMIGRVFGDYSTLQRLPNVHFLGFKAYRELPHYGKHFAAAFMCWKMTDWIRHSNPLKTKEYLSLGLPVVSVRIAELEQQFDDLVHLVDDGPSFLAAVRKALATDSDSAHDERIARVQGESWDAKAEEMLSRYQEALSDD